MSENWKINDDGIDFLEHLDDSDIEKAYNHEFAFKTEKNGLSIISYVSIGKHHVVTLINGAFLNEFNIDLDSFIKNCAIDHPSNEELAEQIHIASVKSLIKNDFKKTILNKFPELEEFMV